MVVGEPSGPPRSVSCVDGERGGRCFVVLSGEGKDVENVSSPVCAAYALRQNLGKFGKKMSLGEYHRLRSFLYFK